MSYDLQIWSVKRCDLTELLAKHDFKRSGEDFYYEGKEWQIVVNCQHEVLDEDIPEQIMQILPGIIFFLEINLEPIGAPKKAVSLTKKIAKSLAQAVSGIVIDLQEDTIITPKGVKRSLMPEKLPDIDILKLSWWMNHDLFTETANLQALVDKIEVYLPEALPKRYGLTEPPQYKFNSKKEFVDFLVQNERSIIWYPHYPVMGFHLGIPPKVGPITWAGKPSYRASHISISLDAAVLGLAGWSLALKRFFREMSLYFKPFYGDIRLLHGYVRMRGTYGSNSRAEQHPIKGWWWRGIPSKADLAILLGDPLIKIWPDFVNISERIGEQIYISDNYQDGCFQEMKQELLSVPNGLIQPDDENRYPDLWPFEFPK